MQIKLNILTINNRYLFKYNNLFLIENKIDYKSR